jgi:hypothetical protein
MYIGTWLFAVAVAERPKELRPRVIYIFRYTRSKMRTPEAALVQHRELPVQLRHHIHAGPAVRVGVGSKAPIRGPLPLLGPAAGSVGSLRRMSQGRVFRREASEAGFVQHRLCSQRSGIAHNSTEVLELATKY